MSNTDDLLWLVGFKTKLALNERLMAAVVKGDEPAVIKMIKLGADVNTSTLIVPNPQKRIAGPLMAEIDNFQLSIAEILLENGADPTAESVKVYFEQNYTPLSLCVKNSIDFEKNKLDPQNQYPKLIRNLLEKGADINKKIETCYTLLSYSAERRSPSMVSLLLSLGSEINDGKSDYTDALDCAIWLSDNLEVVSILEDHMLNQLVKNELLSASSINCAEKNIQNEIHPAKRMRL